ncbi:pirin family protein [Phenylobacterium sp.]|jgi:redox-sensitive bicupin YhaK (pirin superfamily)|uniref:pirin family protein n=1 Tax=Phenylobacterium sp. TaxID=1871053 RepID=UPI002F93FE6D
MLDLRPYEELGSERLSWLTQKLHFSVGSYFNPERMGWSSLRVWNDDEIAPGAGFPLHGHMDMEIVTFVQQGAITHADDLGHSGRIEAGDVQVMSAGSGIRHSEYNLEFEPTRIFQIWITPAARGGRPSWDTRPFPRSGREGRFAVLASGFNDPEALPINAPARVAAATLRKGQDAEYALANSRRGYLVPLKGRIEVNGLAVGERDGLAISEEDLLRVRAADDAEVVLVDLP